MIMNWVLVEIIVIIVFLHTALIWIQEVQRNYIDVKQKETNQYPRWPFETNSNYQTLIHDVLSLSTNSVQLSQTVHARAKRRPRPLYQSQNWQSLLHTEMTMTTLNAQTAYRYSIQWSILSIIYKIRLTTGPKHGNITSPHLKTDFTRWQQTTNI